MRAYAIEVSDRWDHWHVARNLGQLSVFVSKKEAVEQLEKWTNKEIGLVHKGVTWAGIHYRIRPFHESRIGIRKRKKVLKESR